MPPAKKEKGAVVKKEKVTVKKEKVSIKKELADASTGVRSRKQFSAKDHYRHQVAFLDECVKPPWTVVFGALGTGIIGIQPDKKSSRVKQEKDDSEDSPRIPKDATVALLVNAPACGFQGRNGTAMGGYGDMLDEKKKALHWKSQRSDRGRVINAIVEHQRGGGRVVVGVRAKISAGNADSNFTLLGVVSRIDGVKEAQQLVQDGDNVICDGAKIHKSITTACLDAGLKVGIGLMPRRYPLPEKDAKNYTLCRACCFVEANCMLHFADLKEDGVATYKTQSKRAQVAQRAKQKVKKEPGSRGKVGRSRVKKERGEEGESDDEEDEDPEDEEEDEEQASEAEQDANTPFELGERVQRRDKSQDIWGFGYVVSLDPLEVTAKDEKNANGFEWKQVRHIPKGFKVTMKRPAAMKKVPLGRMQLASKKKKDQKQRTAKVKKAPMKKAGLSLGRAPVKQEKRKAVKKERQ